MAVAVNDVRMGNGNLRAVHSFFMPRKGKKGFTLVQYVQAK